MPVARVPLIFGTMTIGEKGKSGTRITSLEDSQAIIDTFIDAGYTEIDTARMYGEGTTEAYLSKLNLRNATIDTKVWPFQPGDHKPENLRGLFDRSLQALGREKVRVFYLHAPDRSVPIEETVAEVDRLHKEGKFEIFGLSNYGAWEVAEIVGICKAKGYVLPQIYQAMYNGITRIVEPELVPALRKFGIRLVIYNPLAGGFFAGKLAAVSDAPEAGSRFDPNSNQGRIYRERYVQGVYFKAMEILKEAAEKSNLRLTEIALRWCQHHSVLTPEDGVILGASSVAQLKQNIQDSEKGPLPQEILEAMDQAWAQIGINCPPYWR